MMTVGDHMNSSDLLELQIRRATTVSEIAACRALITGVYRAKYGVSFASFGVDPANKVEPLPDHYVMGVVGDLIVAAAGLYTRETYVERFGEVTDAEIRRVLTDAGLSALADRPRVEYTRLVVRPGWEGRGIGRYFLAATHSRAFLGTGADGPPLLLACGKMSIFRSLYEAVGIRTRQLKSFPWYRSHERYRSDQDPMESRLIIPEMDIDPRWYRFPLPSTVGIALPEASMQNEVAVGTCGAPARATAPRTCVDLRVSAEEMVQHWHRCSLAADFLAGFVEAAPAVPHDRLELSMIIDELLENAVKFCADGNEPVTLSVRDYGDAVRLEASNVCDDDRARDLEQSIRRVLDGDLEELFLQQIEETAARDRMSSRLGFITLCLNYGARLGARITKGPRGLNTVTIEVLLDRHQEALAS